MFNHGFVMVHACLTGHTHCGHTDHTRIIIDNDRVLIGLHSRKWRGGFPKKVSGKLPWRFGKVGHQCTAVADQC